MSIRPPDLDSSTATMSSDRKSPQKGATGNQNRVAGTLPALWDAPEDVRHELWKSLRRAEELLRPEHWGSGPVVTEDAAYEEIRARYQTLALQAPFDTAPAASWKGLSELAISYCAYTFRPTRAVKTEEAEALVAWFACFWKLDDLVDADRESLPAQYLPELRRVLARAWFGEETSLTGLSEEAGDRAAFRSQAAELLLAHRRQLRALGQPIENHPRYQRAVWDHIVSQTGDVPHVDTLGEYFGVRRIRGGMECVFHMYLALQGVEWREEFERIVDVANVVTCITDDLFSAPRDAREGVVGAVALCGPERALRAVKDLHRELLERLDRLVAFDHGPSTRLFVRTVLDVVLGMLNWQGRNPRYREGARWLADLLRSGESSTRGTEH